MLKPFKCKACGKGIGASAEVCPHCGEKQVDWGKVMPPLLIAAGISIVFLIAICGNITNDHVGARFEQVGYSYEIDDMGPTRVLTFYSSTLDPEKIRKHASKQQHETGEYCVCFYFDDTRFTPKVKWGGFDKNGDPQYGFDLKEYRQHMIATYQRFVTGKDNLEMHPKLTQNK